MEPKLDDIDDTSNGTPEAAPPRRRGRPQSVEGGTVNRNAILKTALKLTRTTPLQDLSIVAVAKAMGVTPALIHYYIGGRDWLTSGVMNLFYKELLRKWPAETGDWKRDLLATARTFHDHLAVYSGIAAYASTNSRFRVFQLVAFGDRDYGIETLDRFVGRVRAAGLPGGRTGMYAEHFIQFVIHTSYTSSQHIFPSEHHEFLSSKITNLNERKYPNIVFAGNAPLVGDASRAFDEGCYLFLLGMSMEAQGIAVRDAVMQSSLPVPAPDARETKRTPKKKPPEDSKVA